MELWADNYDIFRMYELGPGISTPGLVRPKLHATATAKVRARAGHQKTNFRLLALIFIFYHWWVPGTTRPRRLLTLWLLPEYQRVIGFSFQLAIIQHQFALHALGYCHLCKDALFKFLRDLKGRHLEM